MPNILPFRGLRYSEKAGSPGDLIAPPYDVIDEEYRRSLAARSPHNIATLTLQVPGEPDFYSRVKRDLDGWIGAGTLEQDESESYYYLSQEFPMRGRKYRRSGFFGLVDLADTANIIRHEITFDRYKNERMKLLESVKANLEPVFLLYEDNDFVLEAAAGKVKTEHSRLEEVDMEFGSLAPYSITGLIDMMRKSHVFIADGHHRFEASLNYYRKDPLIAPRHIMAYFTNMLSKDLVILPTHRLLLQNVRFEEKLEAVKTYFTVREFPDLSSTLAGLEDSKHCSFGVFNGMKYFLLSLRDPAAIDKFLPAERSRPWKSLDVVVLHYFLLKDILAIPPEEKLYYEHDPGAVVEKAVLTPGSTAFLMGPPEISKLREISLNGETMPPKSTYFFPKVPSGLVLSRYV